MRIAAVVVTHNRPELLRQVVLALQAQTRPLDALYVVDNASDEATGALLAQLGDLCVLRSDTNLGGAGGFALGMEHACGAGFDWIWLLDDDAIPRADALARLADAIDGPASGAGAVCGAVREFGDLALAHRRSYQRWSGLERQVRRAAYANPATRVDTASFVGFLVAAPAIAAVGLPERQFFLAYDDTEYSLRLGKAGFPIWLIPNSIVDHMRSAQGRLRAGPFGRKHYFNIRNRIVVARKYAALPVAPAAGAALVGAALWLASAGRFRRGAFTIFLQAVADGFAGRLGGYPPALAKLEPAFQPHPGGPARSGKIP
jgi:GT2 family glycosyltransferase